MKIISATGDERPLVLVDYQSDVYANDSLILANGKLNFNNTATVNVAVVANGSSYANVAFSVNTSAVGGGGGGNYGADIFLDGSSVVTNANINFLSSNDVTISAVANGSTRANITLSVPQLANAYSRANAAANSVDVWIGPVRVAANVGLNYNNSNSVIWTAGVNGATLRANIRAEVIPATNTGTSGIVNLDSGITNTANDVAAAAYAANLASLVPVFVAGSLIGAHRNVNFAVANSSNLTITGTSNSSGNVTLTFDTRVPTGGGGSDSAAANLVAIYANNTLAMANANVNFNNSATINVAVTANAANKRANISFSVNDNLRAEELVVTFDGGGQVLTTGDSNTYYTIPYSGTIDSWYLTGSPSGNVVIDVWKRAGAIPVNANTIAGTEKPTLASGQTANDTSLSSWTTAVSRGDIFGFEVESVSLVTRATLVIRILRS